MLTDPPTSTPPAGLSAHAFSSLFQAVQGLRDRRAIVALLGCMVVGVLVAALLMAMAGTLGRLAVFLGMLVWLVAIGTGVNAAGLLQMDAARGISQRSIVDALVYGLMCIPKLIVLGLAFFAVAVAVFIAIALVMLICKLPFLGPLLFVVAFPVSVVVAGITVVGIFLCLVLSLPAIWQGASITRALAQTLAIVRSRLVEAVLLLLFVGFLSFVVGFIVFGVLGAGMVPTLGLSASLLGFSGMGDMGSLMGMAQGFGGGSGHVVAGVIGGLILWAVAGSLVGQVYLRGLSLVYLRVTEGLDSGATEAALRSTLDDARRRTVELGEKAKNAATRDSGTASSTSSVPAAPASAATDSAAVPGAASGIAASAATAAAAFSAPVPPAYNPPPAYSPPPTSASADDTPLQASLPVAVDGAADIDLPFDEAPAPPPATAAVTCPQCLSPVTGDDLFCGACGYRLK